MNFLLLFSFGRRWLPGNSSESMAVTMQRFFGARRLINGMQKHRATHL
jgi:hypothetical protein